MLEYRITLMGKGWLCMYISRECQTQDWQAHKMSCRGGRPVPIGLPFVISIQRSQLTYDRLAEVAEKFAR